MITQGFCWHVHHKVLIEWCWDFEEREACIQAHKLPEEIPVRLEWMRMVKGPLPQAVVEAGAALDTDSATYAEDSAALTHAEATLNKAIQANMPAILALHAQECPGCPWDGKTLFPEKKEKRSWVFW